MSIGHPGCGWMVYVGVYGQPRACIGTPTHTAVIRWRTRRVWVRMFLCAVHAGEVDGSEPMTDAHRVLLDARRVDWASALAGRRYHGPPTSTDRTEV